MYQEFKDMSNFLFTGDEFITSDRIEREVINDGDSEDGKVTVKHTLMLRAKVMIHFNQVLHTLTLQCLIFVFSARR